MHVQQDRWEGSRRTFLGAAGRVVIGGTLVAVAGGRAVQVAFGQGTPAAALPHPELRVTTSD